VPQAVSVDTTAKPEFHLLHQDADEAVYSIEWGNLIESDEDRTRIEVIAPSCGTLKLVIIDPEGDEKPEDAPSVTIGRHGADRLRALLDRHFGPVEPWDNDKDFGGIIISGDGTFREFTDEEERRVSADPGWHAERDRLIATINATLKAIAGEGYRDDAQVRKAKERWRETLSYLANSLQDQYRIIAHRTIFSWYLYDRTMKAETNIRRLISEASKDLVLVYGYAGIIPGKDVVIDPERGIIISPYGARKLRAFAEDAVRHNSRDDAEDDTEKATLH
jgi:hypothetical protein